MNAIITAIMWLMFLIVVTAWAVIGFVLWIPLLVRATTVFSAMVVHAAITGQKPDVLRGHLESASRFYPEGFRIAFDVIHKPTNSQPHAGHIQFWRVFAECLWTLAFWILVLMIFYPTLLVPLWTALSVASVAVGDWFFTVGGWWFYPVLATLVFAFGAYIGAKALSNNRKSKSKDAATPSPRPAV